MERGDIPVGPAYVLVTEGATSKIYARCKGNAGCNCGWAYHTSVAEVQWARDAELVLRALLAHGRQSGD